MEFRVSINPPSRPRGGPLSGAGEFMSTFRNRVHLAATPRGGTAPQPSNAATTTVAPPRRDLDDWGPARRPARASDRRAT
jgi:hypothetical protein